MLGAPKRTFVRRDDMNSRRLDAANELNGAREFALERAHAGNLLHEGSQSKRADLVEQFVTRVGALRQTALGEQHARLRALAKLHGYGVALGIDVEGNGR